MKKALLIFTLFASLTSGAQEVEETVIERKDEVKINALMLVLGALEVSYERTINDESGIGVSVFTSIAPEIDVNYSVTPYYRYYFGAKPAAGFFMEGFGMLNSVDEYQYQYDIYGYESAQQPETVVDFALGFGLGGKWVSKKGVTLEVNSGVGRNLFNNDSNRDYTIVGRGGVSVGYRF